MRIRFVLSIALLGAAVLFMLQNVGVVEIRFLIWSVSLSRSLLLFAVLLIGVAVGWLWHSLWLRRARKHAREL
jgi:uncharacterized membrane protein YciS (DUF1049 family)